MPDQLSSDLASLRIPRGEGSEPRSRLLAGGMGVLGGFLPALRAARVSPTVAMRG